MLLFVLKLIISAFTVIGTHNFSDIFASLFLSTNVRTAFLAKGDAFIPCMFTACIVFSKPSL